MKPIVSALLIAGVCCAFSPASAADGKSPLFGGAAGQLMSAQQNKAVVGKGTYADYFGYYGNLYSNYAYYSGAAAYGNGNQSSAITNYYAAYYYSTAATNQYANAYYYAYYGY